MKTWVAAVVCMNAICSPAAGAGSADYAGVIRAFGDAASWMTSCFVVGDGSWVVTTSDAVTEKVGPTATQTIRYPIFISAYSGSACQCELVANDATASIAILRLPIKGLPAAELGRSAAFVKAGMGTLGDLMSGEPVGSKWPTTVHGVTRETGGEGYKLAVGEWDAGKAFITDIGNYKWIFLSDIKPDKPAPSGSMVERESRVIGMYLNKLVITGGREEVKYGRCVLSTELIRFLTKHGGDGASLTEPPKATIKREKGADAAFQLYGKIYTLVGSGRAALGLEFARELSALRPQEAEAQLLLGVALSDSGKFEDALKAFDAAAKLNAKLPTIRTSRALALIGLKKREEAEAEILKAIQEAPADARPVTSAADFYLADEKTFDKALTYARKVTAMLPNSPAGHLLLARAQKRNKDYKGAVASISAALKLSPSWPPAYFALGSTCEEAGDKAAAEKAYRKLVELQPQAPDSLLALASFLADQGKTDEAKEFIAKLRALNPPKEVLDAAKALEDKINAPK